MKPFSFLAVLIVCMVMSFAAFASELVTEYVINFSDHFDQIVTAVFIGASAFVAFVLNRISSLIGLQRDAKIREYLDKAIIHGLAYAHEKIITSDHNIKDVATRSKVVAEASNYLLSKVPDAVKHFNLGDNDLRQMLYARLNQTNQNAVSNAEVE